MLNKKEKRHIAVILDTHITAMENAVKEIPNCEKNPICAIDEFATCKGAFLCAMDILSQSDGLLYRIMWEKYTDRFHALEEKYYRIHQKAFNKF